MKILLVSLFLLISNRLLSKDLFIKYLIKNDFKCKEVFSYKELEEATNHKNKWDNSVIYLSLNKVTIGLMFFEDDEQPNFFFSSSTVISFFSSEIIDDRGNKFKGLLNNFNEVFYVDLVKSKIYNMPISHTFKTKINPTAKVYEFKGKYYDKLNAKVIRIPEYPDFSKGGIINQNKRLLGAIDFESLKKVDSNLLVSKIEPYILSMLIGVIKEKKLK